jgi:hypothetical protein
MEARKMALVKTRLWTAEDLAAYKEAAAEYFADLKSGKIINNKKPLTEAQKMAKLERDHRKEDLAEKRSDRCRR